ncbi:MAG: 50S ribosomal protein L3 [Candidatus Thermoplasmatota archaeon]|jgi:large subunit ribosomal protein L3|nr:50S ribosomal protein L3 [Candidatus Thermoplasmatota archaeon]MCL5790606.1 50S ribosomal protein L3 [Candidatus Thermoplasmatota archaeon]
MATPHHPRRGSLGYYHRKRKPGLKSTIRSWPEIDGNPKIQSFAGYKVGMTHVEMVDYRKNSTTAGRNIMAAVTVVEVPPARVVALRTYRETEDGLKVSYEKWADNLDKEIFDVIPEAKKREERAVPSDISEVRVLLMLRPGLVTGVPKKVPDIFEARVGGSTIDARLKYAQEKLGKDIEFSDFSKAGNFVDVISVTKGKGFTGHVERFGVKLLPRKNRKHRRMIGTLGPWHPDWIRWQVPQAGQMGAHQRTQHNMRVIKYAKSQGENDINVKGGFVNYGLVRTNYVLIHGSVPGSIKRLVKFRDPARQRTPSVENLQISYISRESKQGD